MLKAFVGMMVGLYKLLAFVLNLFCFSLFLSGTTLNLQRKDNNVHNVVNICDKIAKQNTFPFSLEIYLSIIKILCTKLICNKC